MMIKLLRSLMVYEIVLLGVVIGAVLSFNIVLAILALTGLSARLVLRNLR